MKMFNLFYEDNTVNLAEPANDLQETCLKTIVNNRNLLWILAKQKPYYFPEVGSFSKVKKKIYFLKIL